MIQRHAIGERLPGGLPAATRETAAAPAQSPRAGWRRAGLIALPWLLLALVYTPGTVLLGRNSPNPESFGYVLAHYLTMFSMWALATPAIGALLQRFPIGWPAQGRALALHLCFASVLILTNAALMAAFEFYLPGPFGAPDFATQFVENLMYRSASGVLLYTASAACLGALDAWQRYQLRERSIVQAQLDALKAQLEPHFLFNTLNALSELVYRDAAAADRVLTQLAGLLRHLLDSREHEHSLGEEIALLKQYAAIQQTLLGERLRVSWHVPEALLRARVPTLLLQPIVENAIRHGISELRRGGTVSVRAERDGAWLRLRVDNDGPPPRAARVGGVGLSNTRARLQALYGSQQQLDLDAPPAGGCTVRIALPWCESTSSPAADTAVARQESADARTAGR